MHQQEQLRVSLHLITVSPSCTPFNPLPARIVPDDLSKIKQAITEATELDGVDLILTSGGTGFTPDDRTSEAVEQLLTKRADSLT